MATHLPCFGDSVVKVATHAFESPPLCLHSCIKQTTKEDSMNRLLLIAILTTAALQLDLNINEVMIYHKKQCLEKADNAIKKVLKINWKPISIFPKEAQHFR